jgi:hypothetical protein
LNVLFHGPFVFFDQPCQIDVLIPDMEDDHVYRAGEWLAETTLEQGKQYVLSGISGADGTFDPTVNLMVTNMPSLSGNKGVYTRIQLPRPNEITSLCQVTLDSPCLTSNVPTITLPQTLSAEQVFTYDIDNDDPANVKLGDHTMTTSAQPFGNEFYMNLHILAGPDRFLGPKHPIDGFDMAVSLIPALNGKLELKCPKKIPPLSDQDPLPPGCILEEFLDLSRRVERLAFYSRDIRELLAVSPNATLPEWSDLIGIGDEVHTCITA